MPFGAPSTPSPENLKTCTARFRSSKWLERIVRGIVQPNGRLRRSRGRSLSSPREKVKSSPYDDLPRMALPYRGRLSDRARVVVPASWRTSSLQVHHLQVPAEQGLRIHFQNRPFVDSSMINGTPLTPVAHHFSRSKGLSLDDKSVFQAFRRSFVQLGHENRPFVCSSTIEQRQLLYRKCNDVPPLKTESQVKSTIGQRIARHLPLKVPSLEGCKVTRLGQSSAPWKATRCGRKRSTIATAIQRPAGPRREYQDEPGQLSKVRAILARAAVFDETPPTGSILRSSYVIDFPSSDLRGAS